MKIEYQDKIDDYLNGRMSDTEQKEFEKDIQNNPELKDQLLFTENLQDALKSRNDIMERMELWESEKLSKAKKSSVKRIYYWVSGIAALFIVGLFTFSTYLSPYFKSLWTNDTISDNNIKTDNEYEIIESLLADCDYDKALKLIENKELELEFELGIMVVDPVALDTVALDIIDYDENVTNSDSSYVNNDDIENKYKSEYDYILWLKSQALIGLNRIEEATYVLEKLQLPDCKYKAQADSLYKLLKK